MYKEVLSKELWILGYDFSKLGHDSGRKTVLWVVVERLTCVGEMDVVFCLEVILVSLHVYDKAISQPSGKACAQPVCMTLH